MKEITHEYDYVVVGAGLSGMAAAVIAARSGLHVALVQDRSVLGGNAGKEIRILLSGAANCNFAYWRETGLMEELLLENLHSNPTCSIEGWDLVLQNVIKAEKNLDLFLNTTVVEVEMAAGGDHLAAVRGYEMTAETWHTFRAPFFADCTGDGTIAVLAGNPFRMGCEARSEFNESLAPDTPQPFVMGNSIQFRTHDAGRPMPFTPPPWVPYRFTDKDFGEFRPIIREFRQMKGGFWWLEWGGNLDTVHDTKKITDTVLGVVYGVWDYLKNRSSMKDELATWELDWVGTITGKRESRRLEGDYMLTQNDIEQQRHFDDAVAFGGWGFDDHPPDGFFDTDHPSWHWYHAGPYNVPLRSLYSKTIDNLFFAGRNLSATHVALSSTRVMLTCGQLGEAIGAAAAVCQRHGMGPRQLIASGHIQDVQWALGRADHHIVQLPYTEPANLAMKAQVRVSSTLPGPDMASSSGVVPLDEDRLWLFPVITPRLEHVEVLLDVAAATELEYIFYAGARNGSTYPETVLHSGRVQAAAGARQWLALPVGVAVTQPGWHFLEIKANAQVHLHYDYHAPVGLKGYVVRTYDRIRPNDYSRWQTWRGTDLPANRLRLYSHNAGELQGYPMGGMDLIANCLRLDPPQPVYSADNITNPWSRPNNLPQLWISSNTDFARPEWVELHWEQAQTTNEVHILFDSALDVHLTSLWQNYERNVLPSLVRDYRLLARDQMTGAWREVVEVHDNYVRRRVHKVDALTTDALRLEILATCGVPRAQVYSLRVY